MSGNYLQIRARRNTNADCCTRHGGTACVGFRVLIQFFYFQDRSGIWARDWYRQQIISCLHRCTVLPTLCVALCIAPQNVPSLPRPIRNYPQSRSCTGVIGFSVRGGFTFHGLGLRVKGLWFMVYGLWFMVYGLWVMV